MTLRDLADNIQPETQTTISVLRRATPEGFKELIQGLSMSGAGVRHRDADVIRLAHDLNAYRRIRYAVADGIRDEIPQQLLHPSRVPTPLAVSIDLQFETIGGIGNAQEL